jgi:hypothetical protein
MDFLICEKGSGIERMLQIDKALTNIEDTEEAISKAREIATETKEGVRVALFTRDGKPICGWKVIEQGKLKDESIQEIQDIFFSVSPENFNMAKRQQEEIEGRQKDKEESN